MRCAVLTILLATGLAACGGNAPAKCGEAECADLCAKGADNQGEEPKAGGGEVTLSDFEKQLLTPILDDVRAGVRPFNDEGIGICKGAKTCDEFLGLTPGELAPGKYIVRAELTVPNVGEKGTWKVDFDTECTTVRDTPSGESSSTSNYNRSYDVRYAGVDRGYRLQPLRTIESPSRGGKRTCNYKITAPHPDGNKVYEGSWTTPGE
ncbi:MAG: hypothetical protein HN348_04080 [Proteobacteria bacterium]|jgi:hypothetical protein|nr:hypothetical protein [Pseudomonadota bacterium]